MASRHRSRELAVQMTYQWDLDPKSLQDPKVTGRFWKEQAQASDDNREFFELLVQGVGNNWPTIDRVIEEALKNWKMARVEKVDLAVLRVAAYEILFFDGKDPPDDAVVINEAIELAKKFGTSGSPGFVNGILDALARGKREKAKKA